VGANGSEESADVRRKSLRLVAEVLTRFPCEMDYNAYWPILFAAAEMPMLRMPVEVRPAGVLVYLSRGMWSVRLRLTKWHHETRKKLQFVSLWNGRKCWRPQEKNVGCNRSDSDANTGGSLWRIP
jgi:hypothetical protein